MSGIIDPRTIRERTWKIMKSMIEKKERKKERNVDGISKVLRETYDHLSETANAIMSTP